ncbi:UDP-glucuronosyltransferase [Aphelenchoides besseyi]|nr:UDP-glucuronosyltransferase [Aphelenchoides besseyi]
MKLEGTCFLLVSLLLPLYCNAYRYLFVTGNLGFSHLQFNGRLADALVDNGHEVDFVVARWVNFVPGNGTERANVIHYTPKKANEILKVLGEVNIFGNPFEREIDFFADEVIRALNMLLNIFCSDILSNEEFLNELRSRKYDAAVSESYDSCSRFLFYKVGIPNVMGTSATALSEMMAHHLGLPMLGGFRPVLNSCPVSPLEMTFMKRARNFYQLMRYIHVISPKFAAVFDQIGQLRGSVIPTDAPKAIELTRNLTMHFVNTFSTLDLPHVTLPTIFNVGGELTAIYAKAKKGVIIFSFGSIVDPTQARAEIRNAFLHTFKRLTDYQVIWKMAGGNPKTSLLITHAGLNSINEAANFGVPMIAVPLIGDGTYNSAVVNYHKLGIVLNKYTLTKETVGDAVDRVLNDPIYRQRAQEISRSLQRQAKTAATDFVHLVEFATEFPGVLQRLNLPHWNWFFYYGADVVIVAAATSLIVLFPFICVIFIAFKTCMRQTPSVSKKKTQ